jgi:hypothetical protein
LRSIDQNKKFHAMVKDISDQVEWAGEKMDPEDWKRLILAAAYGQKCVPNPFGGSFVVINTKRSRDLPMPSMADLITQMLAFGNERGVEWTDPEWQSYLREIREEEIRKAA